jgi:hypothetical protein
MSPRRQNLLQSATGSADFLGETCNFVLFPFVSLVLEAFLQAGGPVCSLVSVLVADSWLAGERRNYTQARAYKIQRVQIHRTGESISTLLFTNWNLHQ